MQSLRSLALLAGLAVLAGCPTTQTDSMTGNDMNTGTGAGGGTGTTGSDTGGDGMTGGAGTGAVAGVSLRFDNTNDEAGVTTAGATDFSIRGSTWTGGVVDTQGQPPLYASGAFSYEVQSGNARVSFDPAVDAANFFYVHGGSVGAGTATAFDGDGNMLGTVSSLGATTFGDSANFVTLDFSAAIARIDFSGGIIDNFAY